MDPPFLSRGLQQKNGHLFLPVDKAPVHKGNDKTIPEQTPWILFVSRIRNVPIYSLGQYLARNEAIFRREAASHSLGDFFAPEGGFLLHLEVQAGYRSFRSTA